jgi:hypothetical protein
LTFGYEPLQNLAGTLHLGDPRPEQLNGLMDLLHAH